MLNNGAYTPFRHFVCKGSDFFRYIQTISFNSLKKYDTVILFMIAGKEECYQDVFLVILLCKLGLCNILGTQNVT